MKKTKFDMGTLTNANRKWKIYTLPHTGTIVSSEEAFYYYLYLYLLMPWNRSEQLSISRRYNNGN